MAMYTLVCCHSTDPFNSYPGPPPDNIADITFWGNFWGSMVRPCVPLFVMITGALLLPIKGDTTVFYKKRILRVLWPFIIWSVLYNIFPWVTGLLGLPPTVVTDLVAYAGEEHMRQSFAVAMKYIAEIPFNFSLMDVHMWYIYTLIGLYLYMPIFSAWVEKASERAKLWFLIAWGITSLLPYYCYFVSEYVWGTCSWNAYGMLYMFAGFNGYLLLGHYLRNREWSLKKTLLLGIPMFAIGASVTFFGYRYMTSTPNFTANMSELFFTYCSLNVIMMTIPCFMIAKKIKIHSELVKKLLANLTICGFGLYMIHYFFIGLSVNMLRAINVPLSIQIPIAAVITLSISWIVINLIRKALGNHAKIITG
jgi:surface polysaccharide O-acyltransferase-like enzyme